MSNEITSRCSCCGKSLKNPESVAIGIGPECRTKLTNQRKKPSESGDLFPVSPVFDYWVSLVDSTPVLMIVDLCDEYGGKSVTNGAEEVLRDIEDRAGKPLPEHIIYKDTMGNWDRLIWKRPIVNFAPIKKGCPANKIKDCEAAEIAVFGKVRDKEDG